MHQPYYKHPQTSEFVLPWVRLHASKDYLHMARLLQEFPRVKVNFTMVPSLRDQLEDYARGADDEDTRLTMRTVDGVLADEERVHILRRFFSIHHGNVIHRYQEYRRLLQEAIASHERAFGVRPRGVWPSEGAVSPEAADAIRKAGLAWFASDEGVLARSVNVELRRDEVGALIEPGLLYRPYRLANGATVIF